MPKFVILSVAKYKELQNMKDHYYKLIDIIYSQEKTIRQLQHNCRFVSHTLDFPNSENKSNERGFNSANTTNEY